eukprot:CAMPEP_0196130722 /NCGR_PEP_ID=MMETSP0910-20130528/1001_1 /TAXON_ID=49265 /ORGANISM="Thalassiosira rotula, Strain GSO102" /LENGTH=361 /DNA_ID=CAMNT_0041390081 /DNA_START=50 /DNA_END=1135 /DNA_ORIENTATION=-
MNAAVTLSNALLSSRRAIPKHVLRQYTVTMSAAATTRVVGGSNNNPQHHHPPRLPQQFSSFQRNQLLNNPIIAAQHPSSNIQRRSLFIQTATTPNPESLKFIPNGRLVLGHNAEDVDDKCDPVNGEFEIENGETNEPGATDTSGVYLTRKDHTLIARSPLSKSLFNLDPGIKSIYLGYDFLTVTKFAEAHWTHLQTPIFGCIMDFYATSQPVMTSVPQITDTTILDDDDEVVAMIKELLETRIRPAVQEDGGDIRYVGFEEETGIVTVQLAGSCVGCPSSSVTLKNGVENMLMHYIPEVTNVVSLEEEGEEEEMDAYDEYEKGGDGVVVEQSGAAAEAVKEGKKMKTYQDKLAAAGIPFSD